MEIDFHFGVTYVVGRIAGLSHDEAQVVATCSQYVDDTVNTGVLKFESGQAFYRISTAHEKSDYRIALHDEERRVWVPFHFLPGDDPNGDHQTEFFNRIVCRPNSPVAQKMLENCILKKSRPFGLHQLGITAHVYIDTWAHQGFAGVKHPINVVTNIELQHPSGQNNFFRACRDAGIIPAVWQRCQPLVCKFLDSWFPMGHGAALHYPDHPFRRWTYKNGHGQVILRDNPKDFLDAADSLCVFMRRYIAGNPAAPAVGLPIQDRIIIERMILDTQDDNPEVRNEVWKKAARDGVFSFGVGDPQYFDKGKGSWKYFALGVETAKIDESRKFSFASKFLTADWKLFHDAAKAHQFELLTEILPGFGISAI